MSTLRQTILKGVAVLMTLTPALVASAAEDVVLAENGATEYAVLLPDDASEVQKTAAEELRNYLRQIADVELPVMTESEAASAGRLKTLETAGLFVIGPSATSQRALGELDESKIGYDGIVLKNVGSSFVLTGSPERGPLYAVYEFLERKCGVRWWTAQETTVPRAVDGRLAIEPTLDVVYAPKIRSRESYYLGAFDGPRIAAATATGRRFRASMAVTGPTRMGCIPRLR